MLLWVWEAKSRIRLLGILEAVAAVLQSSRVVSSLAANWNEVKLLNRGSQWMSKEAFLMLIVISSSWICISLDRRLLRGQLKMKWRSLFQVSPGKFLSLRNSLRNDLARVGSMHSVVQCNEEASV